MINKDNKQIHTSKKEEPGYIDTARMDVNGHILIKDKDTKEILVNKRG